MDKGIDPRLIVDCIANQRAAQRELYDRCLPYLGLIARRYLRDEAEIKDALQDSFIAIFQKLPQFDASKASFKTWATRVVINNCLKRNARNKKTTTVELLPDAHAPSLSPEVLTTLSDKELTDWLRQMPPEYYEVFNLNIIEGFSHAEIADLLGIEVALSRQRLSRARKWLAKACHTDANSPLRAEYTYRKRLQLAPLVLSVLAFIDQVN